MEWRFPILLRIRRKINRENIGGKIDEGTL